MNKLYIIEGVPGSGKTTFAGLLAKKLAEKGKIVHTYVEGDLHPADMAWLACLTEDEYSALADKYPDFRDDMDKNSEIWKGYRLLAYTKLDGTPDEFDNYCADHEVYDGRASDEIYYTSHKKRWANFGKNTEDITIFECALLQNHVNELMLFRDCDEQQTVEFIDKLARSVASLDPEVIYLDVDTDAAINRAAAERVDEAGNRRWETGVSEYIAASPYGKREGLSGSEGLYEYFRRRRDIELRILGKLPVKRRIVKLDIANQKAEADKAVEDIAKEL